MPLISILVPVYKVEPYLRQCLDSVLAQTFTDYECILVDDGSPDKCPAICDEYAAKDTRFKVIHKENGGLSDARNVGIQAAAGKYIALLDSDDLFADNAALSNLSNVIEQTKAEVIFNSNLTTFTETSREVYDGINKDFISGDPLQFYTQIMRSRKLILAGCLSVCLSDFLKKNNFFFKKGIYHEDEHWMPRIFCAAQKIVVNHSPFYSYRTAREGSIMASTNPAKLYDLIGIIEDMLEWAAGGGYPETAKKIFRWRMAQLWYGVYRRAGEIRRCGRGEYRQIYDKLRQIKRVLLGGRKIKYRVFYVLVSLFGR
jgi:glycosyltransferase involved in cell wall biosynthesis